MLKGITISTSEKPLNTPRLYHGILITKEEIQEMIQEQFTLYGIEDQIPTALKVAFCESGYQVDPPHNNDCRGVVQFKPATFSAYCSGDLMNPLWQIKCMAKLWKAGHQGWWECYNIVKQKGL